jgi:hypothetical protein
MSHRRRNRTNAALRCAVENLETRRLFVGFTVEGTEGPDTISLGITGNDILFVVNGVSDSRSDIIFNEVTIDALGGNDTISIIATGNNTVTVNGGLGNDTINFTPGANDLDAIDDNVTVSGDGGTDSVVFHDQSETLAVGYTFGTNTVGRTNMPTATVNAEGVVVHGGSNANQFVLLSPPTPTLTLNGNANSSAFDSLFVTGAAGQSASYTPSASTPGSGTVVFQGRVTNFATMESVVCTDVPAVTFVSPNANDTLSLSSAHILTGSSGGVSFSLLELQDCGTFTIDVAANDGGAGNDTVSLIGTMLDATQVNLNAGTGTNAINVTGAYTIDTNLGAASGTNLAVTVGNSAVATFADAQNLLSMTVVDGATARFNGLGIVLAVDHLRATSGEGTVLLDSNQTLQVQNSFTIGAGDTLRKTGDGTLVVAAAAAQSHAAGAQLIGRRGVVNLNSDAGSTSARPLSIFADGGTINLNATQHLNTVATGIGGAINLGAGGNRVLVCNDVFVETEGSAINLNNNDMILDYSGATQLENVRLMLRGGFASGAWIGIGINSATAAAGALAGKTGLGYAEATDLFTTFPATFSGQQVDNSAILIKFTFYGDANLDGSTNLSDFNVLAGNFGQSDRRWVRGDNDYNLTINLADFNRLAAGFGGSGLAPDGRGGWKGDGTRSVADEVFDETDESARE